MMLPSRDLTDPILSRQSPRLCLTTSRLLHFCLAYCIQFLYYCMILPNRDLMGLILSLESPRLCHTTSWLLLNCLGSSIQLPFRHMYVLNRGLANQNAPLAKLLRSLSMPKLRNILLPYVLCRLYSYNLVPNFRLGIRKLLCVFPQVHRVVLKASYGSRKPLSSFLFPRFVVWLCLLTL